MTATPGSNPSSTNTREARVADFYWTERAHFAVHPRMGQVKVVECHIEHGTPPEGFQRFYGVCDPLISVDGQQGKLPGVVFPIGANTVHQAFQRFDRDFEAEATPVIEKRLAHMKAQQAAQQNKIVTARDVPKMPVAGHA